MLQHPDELFHLLNKVIPFLKSKNWETRSAAAKAIGSIVENAPKFDPNSEDSGNKSEPGDDIKIENDGGATTSAEEWLQLDKLDINAILTNGKKLLGYVVSESLPFF